MTPQIIGTKKSGGFRRCQRYCRERGLEFQHRDPIRKPLSSGELDRLIPSLGSYDALIDEDSQAYAKRGLAYMEYDPAEELNETPELLRMPIVRTDLGIAVDPDEAELDRLFGRG